MKRYGIVRCEQAIHGATQTIPGKAIGLEEECQYPIAYEQNKTNRATNKDTLTSASVKNHRYCLRLALANSTGTHPPTRESNRDFLVMESPGGAGQYWARWKSIIWLEAFTTCVVLCVIGSCSVRVSEVVTKHLWCGLVEQGLHK